MKPISIIRESLGKIEGALGQVPSNPGYEGHQDSVNKARNVWAGENSILTHNSNYGPETENLIDVKDGEYLPYFDINAAEDELCHVLDGNEGKLHQSIQLHGMDALGWYVSFHNSLSPWGIYIPVSGIVHLTKYAFGGLSATFATKAQLSFHAILNHELFHFANDYAIAQAELAHREPWYVPARSKFRGEIPDYCIEEEKLANAYMLSAFRTLKSELMVKGKQSALRSFVKKQPEGYRDALSVRPPHWDRLLAKLAHRYGSSASKSAHHPLIWDSNFGYDWSQHYPIIPRIDWRYCPIHLVDDVVRIGFPLECSKFITRINIKETEKFQDILAKLAAPIQRAWERTKIKCRNCITSGMDFKKWPKGGPDCFSIRVNDGYRAHLNLEKESGNWFTIKIGTHKEMGHG